MGKGRAVGGYKAQVPYSGSYVHGGNISAGFSFIPLPAVRLS